jgi:type IV pilus assembly protein PilC
MSGVIESIQGGLRLSQSLAQYPEIFNPVFTSLIRAGEDTGKLPDVLRSLVENLKWEDELAEHMKKLVMYPAFVGTIVLMVTFFLMIYLVPQMVAFIRNMGQQIPCKRELIVPRFRAYWWAPGGAHLVLRRQDRRADQPGVPISDRSVQARDSVAGDIMRRSSCRASPAYLR